MNNNQYKFNNNILKKEYSKNNISEENELQELKKIYENIKELKKENENIQELKKENNLNNNDNNLKNII